MYRTQHALVETKNICRILVRKSLGRDHLGKEVRDGRTTNFKMVLRNTDYEDVNVLKWLKYKILCCNVSFRDHRLGLRIPKKHGMSHPAITSKCSRNILSYELQ
jgi:hypothetical protein